MLLLLDDVVGRMFLTALQYGVLGCVAAFFGRLCKIIEGSELMVLGVLETKFLLTDALCHSLVGISCLLIVDSLLNIRLGSSLLKRCTKYSSFLMINANATDEVTLRPSELSLFFCLLLMLRVLARVQIFPVPDIDIIRRNCTLFAFTTTLGRKGERFTLKKLFLMLLSLQLSILFSLHLFDLIFLELLQHVAESAIHLRNSSIEAPDDAPRA